MRLEILSRGCDMYILLHSGLALSGVLDAGQGGPGPVIPVFFDEPKLTLKYPQGL